MSACLRECVCVRERLFRSIFVSMHSYTDVHIFVLHTDSLNTCKLEENLFLIPSQAAEKEHNMSNALIVTRCFSFFGSVAEKTLNDSMPFCAFCGVHNKYMSFS